MIFTREGNPLVRAWVLYDGECAVCIRLAEFWKRTLLRRGMLVAPLQSEWVRARFRWEDETMLREMRVLTANGEVFGGSDACLQVAKRIWWAWPLYAIFRLPGFKYFAKRGYKWFAEHRHCVSNACRLDSRSGRHAH